jgi:hypothetical protein
MTRSVVTARKVFMAPNESVEKTLLEKQGSSTENSKSAFFMIISV